MFSHSNLKHPSFFGAPELGVGGQAQRNEARDKLGKIRDAKFSWFSVYSTEVGHYPQESEEPLKFFKE